MKVYDLSTRFNFGKYEGKSLEEVFMQDPVYIEKCMITVEDFAVDEKTLQKLFEKYPDVEISDTAIDTNLDKLDAMDMEDDDILFSDSDGYDEEDIEDFAENEKDLFEEEDDLETFDDDDAFEADTFEDDWEEDEDFR